METLCNKISLLIPTMNRPKALGQTLDSFMASEVVPEQIIIVDQSESSEDQILNQEALSKYKKEANCIYLRQSIPSLTVARNTAMSYATNELIVISDDDVLVYEDTLKNIVDIMQDNNVVMIAGINDNDVISKGFLGYLFGTKSFFMRKQGHVTSSMLGRYPHKIVGEVATQWAMGYFSVFRASFVNNNNIAWDENLTGYAYAEDLDFSYRLFKAAEKKGNQCILSDRVRVKHLASTEYRIPSKKSTYMYVLNRYYLSYKHGRGFTSILAMDWTNFWMLMMRIVKRQKPLDMLNAMLRAKQLQKKLKSGRIDEKYYE